MAPKDPRRALGQTERHAEAPGLHQKANEDSWGALKGTHRSMVCPEMHTGAPRMHQKAHRGIQCILKCTLRLLGSRVRVSWRRRIICPPPQEGDVQV